MGEHLLLWEVARILGFLPRLGSGNMARPGYSSVHVEVSMTPENPRPAGDAPVVDPQRACQGRHSLMIMIMPLSTKGRPELRFFK